MSCRLRLEELHAFDLLCDRLGGATRSHGLRAIVRMAAGFLDFSQRDSEHLEAIRHALAKIGTNVNQVALAANRGRIDLVKAQWSGVDDLRHALPDMLSLLNLVIAERRRGGIALFRAFAAAENAERD